MGFLFFLLPCSFFCSFPYKLKLQFINHEVSSSKDNKKHNNISINLSLFWPCKEYWGHVLAGTNCYFDLLISYRNRYIWYMAVALAVSLEFLKLFRKVTWFPIFLDVTKIYMPTVSFLIKQDSGILYKQNALLWFAVWCTDLSYVISCSLMG